MNILPAAKAWLVDLDGTLADTAEANFRAYRGALREAGIGIDRARFDREAFGRNWRQFLPPWIEEAGGTRDPAARAAEIAARKAELYRETVAHVRFNRALAMLLACRGAGVLAALVTTASSANVAAVLRTRPDIAALFDAVVTGDDVVRHKPDPEAFFRAADLLGVAPRECVVIEDSDIGLQAGIAFGAPVLRVNMDLENR